MNELSTGFFQTMPLYASTFAPQAKTVAKEITKVIFKDPATIVYFADGDKQVSVAQEGDTYSKEAGIAWCFMKHCLGGTKETAKYIEEAVMLPVNQAIAAEVEKNKKLARIAKNKKRADRKRAKAVRIQADAYKLAMKEVNKEA